MEIGRPRARANLSPVWRHFSRIGDQRSCLGSCLHCGTEVAVPGGSTTGMFSHLSVHHPKQYRAAKEDQAERFPPSPLLLRHASSPPPPTASVVSVKSLAPADNIFPHLSLSYSSAPPPPPAPPRHDLVLHCRDGRVLCHRLLLAAASPLARHLLAGGEQREEHIVIPSVAVAEVQELMCGLYSGRLDPSRPCLRQLLSLLGMAVMEQEELEEQGDEDTEYLEPVMHLNIGTALPGLPPDHTDGCFSADYDSLASDAEIEAKAIELKEKIFAECGMVSRKRKQIRNTRNPSKIWKWFTKTPDFIYCKVCGVGIKNSGNTTNASSHLKRHPAQYSDFRLETSQSQHFMTSPSEAGSGSRDSEENHEQLLWQYFKTSPRFNRKAICTLCGKETPSGSSNTLLHLKHHHPKEFTAMEERQENNEERQENMEERQEEKQEKEKEKQEKVEDKQEKGRTEVKQEQEEPRVKMELEDVDNND